MAWRLSEFFPRLWGAEFRQPPVAPIQWQQQMAQRQRRVVWDQQQRAASKGPLVLAPLPCLEAAHVSGELPVHVAARPWQHLVPVDFRQPDLPARQRAEWLVPALDRGVRRRWLSPV